MSTSARICIQGRPSTCQGAKQPAVHETEIKLLNARLRSMAEGEEDELDALLAQYDEQAAREVQALEAAQRRHSQPRKPKDRERQGREAALETPLSQHSK